jgi:hypothetical protein
MYGMGRNALGNVKRKDKPGWMQELFERTV